MKKILSNLWLQLIFGFMGSIISVILFNILALAYYFKYSGLGFITSSGGDNSLITILIAGLFFILALSSPLLVWFTIFQFGNLSKKSRKFKILTIIIFAIIPLKILTSLQLFSDAKKIYKSYRAVRDACSITNGVNRTKTGEYTSEVECKNGIYNGLYRLYNGNGRMLYQVSYLNGVRNGEETTYNDNGALQILANYENGTKNGTEIFYNENGSINLYIYNKKEKAIFVYNQIAEKNPEEITTPESQNFYCSNIEELTVKNYKYSCMDSKLDGVFQKSETDGTPDLIINFNHGQLDGVYEKFINGKLSSHLEFSKNTLNGKIYKYHSNGNLEYQGRYINGLQEGMFQSFSYEGELESEVIFENGSLIKINKPEIK